MGKCLSRPPKIDHKEVMQKFEQQIEQKKEKEKQKYIKYKTMGGVIRSNSIKKNDKRYSLNSNFQTRNFVIKNQNHILDEYRYLIYTTI